MRSVYAAALAAFIAVPAIADETEGLVLAYDRQASVLILSDYTAWELPSDLLVPSDLRAGDRVMIEYQSAGEDGLVMIDALTRLAKALPKATDGGA